MTPENLKLNHFNSVTSLDDDAPWTRVQSASHASLSNLPALTVEIVIGTRTLYGLLDQHGQISSSELKVAFQNASRIQPEQKDDLNAFQALLSTLQEAEIFKVFRNPDEHLVYWISVDGIEQDWPHLGKVTYNLMEAHLHAEIEDAQFGGEVVTLSASEALSVFKEHRADLEWRCLDDVLIWPDDPVLELLSEQTAQAARPYLASGPYRASELRGTLKR